MKKITADAVFDGYELHNNIVISHDDEGTIRSIEPIATSDQPIQHYSGILSPGFVNTHCHLELSYLQGLIPEDTGLMNFVSNVMQLRHHPIEKIKGAIEEADNQMWNNGIQAVGDICNTTHTLGTKLHSKIRYYNFVEIAGFLPTIAQERFDNGTSLYQSFIASGDTAIVPHAPYSVSPELFTRINNVSQGNTISIHNQETEDENLLFEKKEGAFLELYRNMNADISFFKPSGNTSLQTYFTALAKAKNILLVHNTCTNAADIDYASSQHGINNTFWTLCPNANWYIERKQPPIPLLLEKKVAITLGTDSLASNYSLNILDEIKRIKMHHPTIPLQLMLQWATINGAKALQMDAQIGSLEVGKKPGIILIDNNLESVKRIL